MTEVRTILTLVAVVAALILNAVVAATASGADSARFEAESMTESSSAISVVSDPAASGGRALRYTNDKGPADKTVTLVAPSERVVVRARATQGGGSPSIRLLVDGVDRGTKAVRIDSYADQVFDVPRLAPGSHTVVLRAVNATSNRSLFADTVAFVAVETPPETTGGETTGGETTAPPPEETTVTPPPPPPPPPEGAGSSLHRRGKERG